jgi:hypothetical protein
VAATRVEHHREAARPAPDASKAGAVVASTPDAGEAPGPRRSADPEDGFIFK